jgi:hypothetical protein
MYNREKILPNVIYKMSISSVELREFIREFIVLIKNYSQS